jgi:hypothetical protein
MSQFDLGFMNPQSVDLQGIIEELVAADEARAGRVQAREMLGREAVPRIETETRADRRRRRKDRKGRMSSGGSRPRDAAPSSSTADEVKNKPRRRGKPFGPQPSKKMAAKKAGKAALKGVGKAAWPVAIALALYEMGLGITGNTKRDKKNALMQLSQGWEKGELLSQRNPLRDMEELSAMMDLVASAQEADEAPYLKASAASGMQERAITELLSSGGFG